MKNNRRDFLKLTGMAGISIAGAKLFGNVAIQIDKKSRVIVDRAVVSLEDGKIISVPFWRIESGREGSSLAMIASQHGNEVQGAEIALRFKDICARSLVSGSVWLIPMANLLAVRSRKHSFNLGPEENNEINPGKIHNMQRNWPGNPDGNDTARIAYALDQAALRNCSHLIDIHNWNHFAAAETLSEEKNESSRMMGDVTATRFISYRNTIIPGTQTMMVSQMMLKRGAGVVVMELSGQFRMNEKQIRTGLDSMVNIAKVLGMINGDPDRIDGKRVIRTAENTHEIKAPCSGIFMAEQGKERLTSIMPDDYIEEGQLLGHIIRETNLETVKIAAPVSGYVAQLGACHWGLCDASLPAQHPYTEEGEVIGRIVTV